ncbi:hypothetical protein PVK06_039816 [Gossypium arboreum]|uniref:CCHC-type domain-containing protein n=1 Tax=Gossypium arboreum TaxID=29729 RepID=A0ABR0N6L7_GOSAR|nr:hypothetical protein PVK06_039816 [Gossypium arboreum]
MKKVGPKPVLMIRNNKGKGKAKVQTKPKCKGRPNPGKGKAALKPKGGVSKKGKYFHCGVTGHWKRNCLVYLEEIKKAKASGTSASDQDEPRTYQEAVTSPDSEKWLKAMRPEMDSMYENQV